MKRFILSIFAFSIFIFSSCTALQNLDLGPSHLETVLALKNILDNSTFRALNTLKNVNDDGIHQGSTKRNLNRIKNTQNKWIRR